MGLCFPRVAVLWCRAGGSAAHWHHYPQQVAGMQLPSDRSHSNVCRWTGCFQGQLWSGRSLEWVLQPKVQGNKSPWDQSWFHAHLWHVCLSVLVFRTQYRLKWLSVEIAMALSSPCSFQLPDWTQSCSYRAPSVHRHHVSQLCWSLVIFFDSWNELYCRYMGHLSSYAKPMHPLVVSSGDAVQFKKKK